MICSAAETGEYTKWEDYPQEIKDMKGMYWDEVAQEIKWCTAWDYTVDLALKRSAWLIGPSGIGKSTLQAVWARFWCRSCLKPSFLYGKHIDPIGVLSKDNKIDCVGAMCLADFNFKTLADTPLDHEDMLSLCGVFETGSITARYGCAMFPKHLRRVFSGNLGKNVGTRAPDPGHIFEKEGCARALAYLARGEEQKLKDGDDQMDALARRSVIFVLGRDVNLKLDTKAVDDEHAEILAREQHNRERA